jgi:hypothetical protein
MITTGEISKFVPQPFAFAAVDFGKIMTIPPFPESLYTIAGQTRSGVSSCASQGGAQDVENENGKNHSFLVVLGIKKSIEWGTGSSAIPKRESSLDRINGKGAKGNIRG